MKNLRRNLTIALLACIAAGGLYFYVQSQKLGVDAPEGGTLRDAPSFALKDSQGREHSLSELRGSVVVLHFWASWCPPCLEEIPRWLQLAAQYKGKPVKFVAISLDQSWPEALKILSEKQASENGVLSLLDAESEISEKYGSYQFPETYLITTDLRILAKWVGPQEWMSGEIRGAIEAAAARHD